jgi:hypothetical protein
MQNWDPKEKEYVQKKYKQLHKDFDDWKSLYQDVRDFVFPYVGEFEGDEKNQGYHHDDDLLRTMIIKYANILAAGMQWGITSPTRPWIKTGVPDKQVMELPEVKNWFSAVDDIIMDILSRGGFYQENQKFYLEMGVFGTAAMFIQPDIKNGCAFHTFTIGEYFVGVDSRGKPNSFGRIMSLTKDQLKEEFDIQDDPMDLGGVNNGYYTVYHLIAPNPDADDAKLGRKSMAYREWYWTKGQKILRIGGYNDFPVTVGRWFTKGSDVYGTGPGIWSLGDAKQMQVIWRDITMASELMVKPPMQAPSSILASGGINLMPSAANYYDPAAGDVGIKPLFEINPNMQGAVSVQQALEDCIKEHFNVKVFQMLSEMDKSNMTAREVIELSAEKMSQMGPLVDRMETEILPTTVDRVINICMRLGLFPPPPDAIQGAEIQIKYRSVLAQAQQQNSITPILDTISTVIGFAAQTQQPEILDKIDFDNATDKLGDLNGLPTGIIRDDGQVAQIRQARAQQQQLLMQQQQIAQAADIAKTASQAKTGEPSALTDVLGGGAAAPIGLRNGG